MPIRFVFTLLLSVMLSGCAVNEFRAPAKGADLGKVQAENKGIVLLYTSLHASGCRNVSARIARSGTGNQYTDAELYHLNSQDNPLVVGLTLTTNDKTMPVAVAMTAGRYGFVQLDCNNPHLRKHFNAKPIGKPDYLTGAKSVYERPLAIFEVKAGEVVDIGTLVVTNVRGSRATGFFTRAPAEFVTSVQPLPEAVLQNLATNKPEIYSARVSRPMIPSNKL